MIKLFWPGLLSLLLLSGCGWNGTPTRHNDFVPLTSIEVTAVSSTIAANTSTRLSVIGHYSGAFTRDITDQATWVSGSPTVADFTAGVPGRVKGLTAGTAILTATVGSLNADYTLTVSSTAIKTMTVTPVNPSVASGLTTQLAATGTFVDNTTQDLTFDATWTADASGFASVSDVAASKGLAKGLAVGVATITATFGGTPGTMQLNVTAPVLQSIAVTPANTSIAGFSKTAQFTATGTFSAGVPQDITSSVTWASSQPGIATIATRSSHRISHNRGGGNDLNQCYCWQRYWKNKPYRNCSCPEPEWIADYSRQPDIPGFRSHTATNGNRSFH